MPGYGYVWIDFVVSFIQAILNKVITGLLGNIAGKADFIGLMVINPGRLHALLIERRAIKVLYSHYRQRDEEPGFKEK